MNRWCAAVAAVVATGSLGACADDGSSAPPARSPATLGELPLIVPPGFPEPALPEGEPYDARMAELGRHLFYDERLSGNGTQSCASCHQQSRAFTDGRSLAVGSTGEVGPRNSPTLTNVVYNATLNWAHPTLTSLELQALIPLFGEFPVELGVTGQEEQVLGRLQADAIYADLFEAAFPGHDEPVTWHHITRALAMFQRALISGQSPFDRASVEGNPTLISESALRGAALFFSEIAECHHCHGGFNFTQSSTHAASAFEERPFHNTGLYNLDGTGAYPPQNTGVYEVTGRPEDMGKFRAPTLRNVAVTAPYVHDGSVATLEEVIRIYEAGGRVITEGPYQGDGRENPLKSGFVMGFTITAQERSDLIAFLESLTDEAFLTDPRFADPFAPAEE